MGGGIFCKERKGKKFRGRGKVDLGDSTTTGGAKVDHSGPNWDTTNPL